MKVLVIGGGGREHALVWKLRQSRKVSEIYCAPGNGGIVQEAQVVPIAVNQIEELAGFSRQHAIGLTVVGPELPLTLGIVDFFEAQRLPILGPTQAAARLEGSKIFAKEFMQRHHIPTAAYAKTASAAEAAQIVRRPATKFPLVVKADGLAAGKGVIIAQSLEAADHAIQQLMQTRILGSAGEQIVIEEFLPGEEASFLVFSDGLHALPMVPSQDHKRAYDDDEGPNTGGMGAYSADWILTADQHRQVMDRIVMPTLAGMAAEGMPYRGILYVGLMLTAEGPKVVEYNVRMGDPETQPVLFRMQSDLVEVCEAIQEQRLDQIRLEWDPQCSLCIVLASGGYPGKYQSGKIISGIAEAESLADVKVFHAGTALEGSQVASAGGRVLGITARGPSIKAARDLAYQAAQKIHFEHMHYRHDIGARGLRRQDS
jgi:phosphoribosylamine--glycine ligase